ncbi:uncharacterized protein LOC132740494, partial [Ruditapes philippinarum]|uniref:uncharacterized protein LOC132740494 n=1 Tax=Ruditapes philippinarum TaxID=129788 RepID=UPI00295A9E6E
METKNAVLLIVLVLGSVWAESDEVQDGDLHIETFQHGNEEEVTILDKNNKVVATVEILEEEGLQIDKPVEADEHPCFLRSIETESEETTPDDKDICYVRNAVSYEDAMGMGLNATHVFDQCQSLYMLEQQSCDVIDSKAT